MADLKKYDKEILLSVIAFMWLWFVLTNSNPALGNVYLWTVAIYLFLLIFDVLVPDRNPVVTYQKKKGGTLEAMFSGAVGWVILLIVSFVVLKIMDPLKASIGSIIKATHAANPAFSNSQIVNLLTLSFAIGYGETQLFARLLKFFADRFHIKISRGTKYLFAFVVLVIALSIAFIVYHITAKGIENFASLVVVGTMMAISLFMVAHYDGETRQAAWMHIIANGVAGFLILMGGSLLFGISLSAFFLPLFGG